MAKNDEEVMKDKNLIEPLLNQVGEILKQLQEHKGSISQNLNPDVLGKLERLEMMVDAFEELNKKSQEAAQIDPQQLLLELERSPKISPKEKKILERARQMERDAKNLKSQYAEIVASNKVNKIPSIKKSTEKKIGKDRKNKFKLLGGNQGWIPL
jgi:hypothetical protein